VNLDLALDRFTSDTRQLSDDSFTYESISGSGDGERFVAIKKRLESHVWIGDQQPVHVTTGFDWYDGWRSRSELRRRIGHGFENSIMLWYSPLSGE